MQPAGRAPTILTPPAPVSMIYPYLVGTLRVEAEGEGNLRYQWYRGNRGDTSRPTGIRNSPQLYLAGSAGGADRYWVRVSHDYGATDSASVPVELWSTKPLWSSGVGVALRDVAFGNGRFVAVGSRGIEEGRVGLSTGGQVWTQQPTPERFYHVVFGAGRFVASTFLSPNTFWTTTDGETWEPATQPPDFSYVNDLFFVGELFVAVAHGGGSVISNDGLTWRAGPSFGSADPSFAYGNGRYMVLEEDGRLFWSDDFASWTQVPTVDGQDFDGVTWLRDHFVALNAKGQSLVSEDGVDWRYQVARHTENSRLFTDGFKLKSPEWRIQGAQQNRDYASEDGVRWWRTPLGFKNHVAGNGTIVGLDGYNLAWANTLPPDSSDGELPQEIEWGQQTCALAVILCSSWRPPPRATRWRMRWWRDRPKLLTAPSPCSARAR